APTACIVAAVIGGATLGLYARHRIPGGPDSGGYLMAAIAVAALGGSLGRGVAGAGGYLMAAIAVAALVGSLGCVIAGVSGIVGMMVGLALGTVPVLWWP